MRRLYIFLIPVLLFTVSCQHETEVFDGPSLIDRFGEFQIKTDLAASASTVDFSAGERVHFTAEFSKNIAWLLRITGKETGAVKEIEGFSNLLDQENSLWNGTVTDLPFFNTEDVTVELIIPEEDSLTVSTEVSVTGLRTYEGSLITDFEMDPGASLFQGNFEFELTGLTGIQDATIATPAQGDKFYFFEGTDNVVANFFVGLIRISPSINGEQYFSMPSTVPEQAYFNCFLYGELTPNTIAVIQFFTDTNGDGEFTDGTDQSFQVAGDFPIDFEGWKHIHHTMADIGMSEEQVSQIVAIQILLISNLNGQPNPPLPVKFGIDYMTFTKDQPLAL